MTSNNALSQFADLSPEQRQLLFEKIRQKKLNSARRPVSSSTPGQTDPLQLSPHQQCLLSRIDGRSQSRLVELVFTGALSVTDLQDKMQQYITILGQTGMTYNAGFSQANILMSVTANPRGHRSMIVNKKNYKN